MEVIEFGEKLKKQREAKGMTQQSLADKLYVTRQAVSRWECGARYPDLMTAKRIAMELDTTIDDLVSGEECKRDVEKEPVLSTPVSAFIQTALYAIAAIPYLFMFLFSVRSFFPGESLKQTPAGKITLTVIAVSISYLIGFLFMSIGLYFSARNELSPKRIGITISMTYFKEVLVTFATLVEMLIIRRNGTIDAFGILYILYQLAAPILILLFFVGKCGISVWIIDIIGAFSAYCILKVIKNLIHYHTDLGYAVSIVHIFGELAIIILLIYQAHTLNQKRRSVIS